MKLLLIMMLSLPFLAVSQVKVIPWLPDGHGARITGGRGKQIVHVTHGSEIPSAGSLRSALATSGGANIVFDYAGPINLSSDILVTGNDISIWGQTAPGVIDIRYGKIAFTGNNILLHHLMFSRGDTLEGDGWGDNQPITIRGPGGGEAVGYAIVNCDFRWGVDGTMQIGSGECGNIGIYYSVFGEGLHRSLHPDGSHSKGPTQLEDDDSWNIGYYSTAFIHCEKRLPNINRGSGHEVIGCFLYNYRGTEAMDIGRADDPPNYYYTDVRIEGNYGKPGGDTNQHTYITVPTVSTGITRIFAFRNAEAEIKPYHTQGDDTDLFDANDGYAVNEVPFAQSAATAVYAADFEWSRIGARPLQRTSSQTRIINEAINGTGNLKDCVNGYEKQYSQRTAPADGTSTTLTLENHRSTVGFNCAEPNCPNDYYNDRACTIRITSGTGSGGKKSIIGYNAATRVVTISSLDPWDPAPREDDTYIIRLPCTGTDIYHAGGYDVLQTGSLVRTYASVSTDSDGDGWTDFEEQMFELAEQIEHGRGVLK